MTNSDSVVTLYTPNAIANKNQSFSLKISSGHKLRGGAIIEVNSIEQAKLAESAGAISILVSSKNERGRNMISRMPDPGLVKEIKQAVTLPVMGRARVGHFVEAQVLECIGVDYIDENETMGLADEENYINKHNFGVPFMCGCKDLGEALSRVREGAAMIRTQGDLSGEGDIVGTVRNVRKVMGDIRVLTNLGEDEVFAFAKKISAPYDIVAQTKQMGRLPVVHFAAGGIVTAADVALMMQLGCDGVFVGNDVYDCVDPYKRLRAIVQAVRNYNDPVLLAKASSGLNETMAGLNFDDGVEQFGTQGTY